MAKELEIRLSNYVENNIIYWSKLNNNETFVKFSKKDGANQVTLNELEKGGKEIHVIVKLRLKKGRTEIVNKFLGPLAKCQIKRQALKEQLKFHLESFEEYIKPKSKKTRRQKGGMGCKTKKRKS